MRNKILSLHRQGFNYTEIVKELGCSKSTVSYHVAVDGHTKNNKRTQRNRKAVNYKKATASVIKNLKKMSADEVVAFVKATNPTAFKNSSKSSGRITSVSRSSSHRKIKKAAG